MGKMICGFAKSVMIERGTSTGNQLANKHREMALYLSIVKILAAAKYVILLSV